MTENPSRPDAEELLAQVPWVHALARSIVFDPELAADLGQDALLAALEKPPATTGEHAGRVRGWLATVVRRGAQRRARAEGRRRVRERTAARPEAVEDPAELVERAELQRDLVDEVIRLPDPYREIVLLRYFEGLDSAEIGHRRGCSAGTVRSQLQRGLGLLRQRLDRRPGGRETWVPALLVLASRAPGPLPAGAAAASSATSAGSVPATGIPTSAIPATITGLALGGIAMSVKTTAIALVAGAVIVCGAIVMLERSGPQGASSQPPAGDPDSTAAVKPVDDLSSPAGSGAAGGSAATATHSESAVSPSSGPETRVAGAIAGIVTSDAGEALEGVVVHAVPIDSRESLDDLPAGFFPGEEGGAFRLPLLDDERNRAVTSADGHYAIGDLSPGAYAVVARGAGYLTAAETGIQVPLPSGESVDFALGPGLSIEGVVLDPRGVPVAGADVSARAGGLPLTTGSGDVVMVAISGPGGGNSSARFDGDSRARTRSDADGRFRLDGLPAGNHQVIAQHVDWAKGSVDKVAAGSRDVEVRLTEGARLAGVVLDPNGAPVAGAEVHAVGFGCFREETEAGRDGSFAFARVPAGGIWLKARDPRFPDAVLPRFAVADGEQRADLELRFELGAVVTGVVVDPSGAPLAGANVTVMEITDAPIPLHRKVVTSAEDGSFEFRGLDVGARFRVDAKHPDFLRGRGEPFTAETGELDIGEIALHSGATVAGVVVDGETGAPVAGADVRLIDATVTSRMTEIMVGDAGVVGFGGKRVQSDETGRFEITAVAPGDHRVQVTAMGFRRLTGDAFTVRGDEPLPEQRLVLDRGISVAGRVLGPDGAPLAGATVQARPAGVPVYAVPFATVQSDTSNAQGRFRITGLEEGALRVSARSSGLAPAEVGAQAGDRNLELRLLALGSVSGFVVDAATGLPVPGFSVRLRPRPEAGAVDVGRSFIDDLGGGSEFHDPDGEFLVPDVEPGRYTLQVRAPGFALFELDDVLVDSGADTPLAVRLDHGGAVEGIVRDRAGRPVSGVRVRRVRPASEGGTHTVVSVAIDADAGGGETFTLSTGDREGTVTGEDGRFLLAGLVPGAAKLSFTHADFIDVELPEVEIVRDRTAQLPPVILERGATLGGTFRDADGTLVQHGGIELQPLDERGEPQGDGKWVQLSEGRFRQGGLAAGRYRVTAQAWQIAEDGDGDVEMSVTVGGGDSPPNRVVEEITLRPDEERTVHLRLP